MTPTDKAYVERRAAPREPVTPNARDYEDTLVVVITGVLTALSAVGLTVFFVTML